MTPGPWGVPPPSPTTESKFFNAARRTVTLLVEAGVDQRFWRMHCDRDCHIRHNGQGGRESVLAELERARAHPDAVLLAVLDADLDRIENRLPSNPDVVWTDAHDLETTLFGLPALDKLVAQQVDPEKYSSQRATWGSEDLRQRLFRHAEGIGRLRWLKQRAGIAELLFKKNKGKIIVLFDRYDKCVNKNWSPSLTNTITAILDYSNAQHLHKRDLVAECAALGEADRVQLCNGHDLVGFLAAWLKSMGRSYTEESLTDALAGYCERDWLKGTEMWHGIREWEANHPGFRVLIEEPPS
jgi:hypothetical protein